MVYLILGLKKQLYIYASPHLYYIFLKVLLNGKKHVSYEKEFHFPRNEYVDIYNDSHVKLLDNTVRSINQPSIFLFNVYLHFCRIAITWVPVGTNFLANIELLANSEDSQSCCL